MAQKPKQHFYALVLAGGMGTRLWPLSREHAPKQLLRIVGRKSLLEQTLDRLRPVIRPENTYIIATDAFGRFIKNLLPKNARYQYILEPAARGTANALGAGVYEVVRKDPLGVIVTINSDAVVQDARAYQKNINELYAVSESHPNQLALVGIPPIYPETGYGYIELESKFSSRSTLVNVRRFVEKPNQQRAQQFFASGRHLWNPSMVCARAQTLWQRFCLRLPTHIKILQTFRRKSIAYKRLSSANFDYSILEEEKNMIVLVAHGWGWCDVGHWKAVKEIQSRDATQTVGSLSISHDSSGNLLSAPAGKLIATLGLHGFAVIDTADALLVCPLDRAQEVRVLVEQAKKKGLHRHL